MSNFLCAAPWRGLHINPQGSVKTCCAGDPNMLGNLNSQTIEEILHGPALQEIRQTLRKGQPHKQYCHNCVQAERYGRSERDWHNRLNHGFDPTQVSDIDHTPVLIDIRWNTTCNSSCNYCNEHSSSQWASLKKLSVQSGTRPYYEQVCKYIEQHQESIKKVALIGGEPLLLKENERLLDVMPADCQVDVITNLGVDLESNRIFERLAKRTNVGWNVSFDNIGARFEYVRHGGSWPLIENNIKKIKACSGHRVGIHPLYNIYNATRLTELISWAREQAVPLHWQNLYHPQYLDPLQLGPAIRQLALKELHAVLSQHNLDHSQRKFFQETESSHLNTNTVSLLPEFINHIAEIESKYHTNTQGQFNQLWPEISKLL
jgi:radical SAM protein with 4Fe4S-binding SPASM domain